MRPLMWFRNDLRTRDNTALHRAASMAQRGVVGVFLVSPAQWRDHDWGVNKIDFVLRTVAELSKSLGERNIPLKILTVPHFKDAPNHLLKLAKQCECDALFYNREYEVNEQKRDAAATDAFADAGLAVHAFDDQTILPPDAFRTNNGDFYTVFTPFKRKWMDTVKARLPIDVLYRPRRQERITGVEPDAAPEAIDGVDLSESVARKHWPAGEDEAYRRLENFIRSGLDDYKQQRDTPAIDGTSTLSPYLSCGAISARKCFTAALAANDDRIDRGRQGPVTWISELVWREFYRHVLVGFPRVSKHQPFRLDTRDVKWSDDDDAFARWRDGNTGVPIVDAAMRQLTQIGWMHNRLRMIVAMYLTKDLLIDWRKGEAFFMNHLVDGDLANNNGGWQWSASTGVDAAPYFRIFNPYTQGERYDPDGQFVRQYVPELADVPVDVLHTPEKWPADLRGRLDYPPPLVDHKHARQRALDAFKQAS